MVSTVRFAPGLKLKLGRAAGRPDLRGDPIEPLSCSLESERSMADRVLRLALGIDGGVDDGAFAGNTNAGSGLGGILRGEAAASSYVESGRAGESKDSISGICRVGCRSTAVMVEAFLSMTISGPNAVAILIQPLGGTRVDEQPRCS